jgi:DNA-binding transcriptional regulator YdaS (Cro superfamily)
MSEESNINVSNVQGAQAADVNVSMQDASNAAAAAANPAVTAETLGVTPEQFTKFYSEKDGYNWQAHSKEIEYRAANAAPADDVGAEADAEARSAVSDAGLDWDALEDMVVADGDIDDASYKALADLGIPEAFVNDYIKNVTAVAARHVADVMGAFGGEQNFEKIKEFAKTNYTEAEKTAIDQQLASPETYKLAVDQLMSKAGMVAGKPGVHVEGANVFGGANDGVVGYASDAEMQVDMRNPKYRTDPGFRQEVTRKVAAMTNGIPNPRSHSGGL